MSTYLPVNAFEVENYFSSNWVSNEIRTLDLLLPGGVGYRLGDSAKDTLSITLP